MKKVHTEEPGIPERIVRRVLDPLGRAHLAKGLCSSLYRERPEIRALKNVGRGKRCFIVGNGPSLNKIDLGALAHEDCFAVNGIFLKFPETDFRPTYYVVEDTFVAEDRADEINRLTGFARIFPWTYRDVLTPGADVRYINMVVDYTDYADFPEFSRNAARRVWTGGTVTYINLQLAYYFGYDPVILVGIDHSYKVDPAKNDIAGVDFKSLADDENHFHKDYFGKGYRWHDPKVDRMERAYRKARRIYEAEDRRIVNATAGGQLEVFERASFDSLV